MTDQILYGTQEIDYKAVRGLLGTVNSLAYKVHEIEKHIHSAGRWFGATAAAGVGPGLITSLRPFKVVSSSSASTFGDAIVVLDGTEDFDLNFTPVSTDPHRIFVTTVTNSGIYKIRFANSGWSGTSHTYANMAASVAAGKFTEFLLEVDSTKADAVSAPVQTGRMNIGSILWAQVMHEDASAETVSFLIGLHSYVG